MAEYSITVEMDQNTVKALKDSGYYMYGFKAVRGQSSGMPTVWFSSQNFLTDTTLTWEENYQAYISNDQIESNVVIHASAKADIDLGQTMNVDNVGNVSVTGEGTAGAISIMNNSTTQYTCGMSQQNPSGDYTTLCAFPLYGNGLDLIVPIETVLLMFATKPVKTATVIAQAFAQGALIDLTGVSSRSLSFDINKGWDAASATWMKKIAANSPLQPLLILPQVSESKAARRLAAAAA
ncbi:hypothetical protein [Afifella marina]|uniref:Uncharacterized protein n=1 Tax=Afifella marina DSM 2698 TaxID=1120955 RepID=A0A1G5MET0_AFIMA|nr:hypothetical protein [Afifella marina]SCZ23374.1 hypothetical protein SAMN03080610_00524 [Afifella marina DSM 2698]